MKKLTYEFVKSKFEERGYELLDQTYVNSKTPMMYLCPIHGEQRVTYAGLREGQGCYKCTSEAISEQRKLPYEFVKSKFEERGYILLETEYINSSTHMRYLCPEHGEQKIRYYNLQSGCGCPDCAGHKKLTYEFVRKTFEDRGYTLLETEYINCDTPMRYVCPEHGETSIRYSDLREGKGCSKCGIVKRANTRRFSYEHIKEYFASVGYELISDTYEGAEKRLKYLCPHHGEQEISYGNLSSGKRCPQCKETKGERAIREWLDSNGITYAAEYTFHDLKSDRPLRFDFAVFKNDKKTINALIEFQGIQHYKPVDFGSKGQKWAEEQLKTNQYRDQLKIDYCTSNNIPLLHLPYTEINNISEILGTPDKLQEFFICHPIGNLKE